jgi:uncharacterized protein (UPF0333 family)
MKRKSLPYINDQRGVAMLLELVLVAAVLALVGLAVYQTGHRSAKTASTSTSAPNAKQSVANSAAAAAESAANTEASLSAGAEDAAGELAQTDQDVTNLGGSSNAAF